MAGNEALSRIDDGGGSVEKALVAGWTRIHGWESGEELRDFAQSLARKRSRFAFPDDFVAAASRLQAHLVGRHNR